jgi:hypothetical protein
MRALIDNRLSSCLLLVIATLASTAVSAHTQAYQATRSK